MKLFAALLVLLLFAAPAHAVTLKESSLINRDKVLVGDLFDIDGDLAMQPVGDAPQPGQSHIFDAYALRRVANAYNIDWSPSRLDTKTIIKRDSTTITNAQIVDALQNALADKVPSNNVHNVDVILDRTNLELNLPANIKNPFVHVVDIVYNPRDYRFTGMLLAESEQSETPTMLKLTGRAIPNVMVPILTHNMRSGDVIGDGDVESYSMPINKISPDAITQMVEVVGKELRREIAQGQVLRTRDIREPQLVKRGNPVTMVIEKGPMRVTAQGRALANGSSGDTVRVMNSISNKVIEGRVMPDGSVEIPSAL